MNITFRQLSVFVSIARHGSGTAPQDAAVHDERRYLPDAGGTGKPAWRALFDRLHARLFINHEGQKLLPVDDELLSRMQGVERLFGDDHEDTRLRVGCTRNDRKLFHARYVPGFDRKNGWLPQSGYRQHPGNLRPAEPFRDRYRPA